MIEIKKLEDRLIKLEKKYLIVKHNVIKEEDIIKKEDDNTYKFQQINKKLLMENEVLNCYYYIINKYWDFQIDPKEIKCKKIIGTVKLDFNHIPEWLKYIEIEGSFQCSNRKLTSLKNCPKIIHERFHCMYNNLTNLYDGPTYVGNVYCCYNNNVKFTEEYVRSICNGVNKIFV